MMAPVSLLATFGGLCLAVALTVERIPGLSFVELKPAKPSTDETKTMRAVVYTEHGNTSVLRIDPKFPKPLLADDAVLIEVAASSINPCDFKMRRNKVPGFISPKPKIPGEDVAGIVVEVGAKVMTVGGQSIQVGDRVAAMLPFIGTPWGSAADFVSVKADMLVKLADHVDLSEAAALPLVATTTIQALECVSFPNDQSQAKILIHAGAGGVGTFAIQYAKHVLGMYVATTASKEKEDLLKELGADLVIDYRSERFEDIVEDFDIVFDTMSWAYESRTIGRGARVLKPTGHYLNILSSDWSFNGVEAVNGVSSLWNMVKHKVINLFRRGLVPSYSLIAVRPQIRPLQNAMNLLADSTIRAVVKERFDLLDAKLAYDTLEKGHATGKIVLLHTEK